MKQLMLAIAVALLAVGVAASRQPTGSPQLTRIGYLEGWTVQQHDDQPFKDPYILDFANIIKCDRSP